MTEIEREKEIREIREELYFNILRLIEKGFTFTELFKADYSQGSLSFVFRFREYVLESKKERNHKKQAAFEKFENKEEAKKNEN